MRLSIPGGTGRTAQAALALALACAGAQEASAAAWFAVECTQGYQHNWEKTLPYSWARCNGFRHELDDTDQQYYAYNLDGARDRWEDAADQWFVDDVDLVYANTHGGADAVESYWSMWNQDTWAETPYMRLGDESWQLSVLATYSCKTLKINDDLAWQRMGAVFSGGLRFALGSHHTVWAGWTTDEVGEDFADNLQKKKSFRYSWKDGNSDWDVAQDITIMTTGTSVANCQARRAGMTWQNFPSYPRLRDWQIQRICWDHWDNL